MTDDQESVQAEGNVPAPRSVCEEQYSLFTALVMTAIMFPLFVLLTSVLALFLATGTVSVVEGVVDLAFREVGEFGLFTFLFVVGVIVSCAAARRAFTILRWREVDNRYCRKCDYDLTGNVSGVCPECGEKIVGKGIMGDGGREDSHNERD